MVTSSDYYNLADEASFLPTNVKEFFLVVEQILTDSFKLSMITKNKCTKISLVIEQFSINVDVNILFGKVT